MNIYATTKKRKLILGHLAFWIGYTILNHFINMVQNPGIEMFFIDSIGKYFVAAFIFYTTTYFILPYFFAKKKYLIAGACIILMSFLSFLLKKFLYYEVFIHFNFPELPYTNAQVFFLNMWWWSQYTLFAFGYWYAREGIKKERELRLNAQKQLNAEKEKLALENAYLKAQINPHFLFNTLGYFHNRMLKKDPELAEGLISLTEIMRSSIRKTDKDGMVSLNEEIDNIHNLIAIYQLRYSQSIYISFENSMCDNDLRILPHILITLVENALKHGELQEPSSPLLIKLTMEDEKMVFIIRNKKRNGPKELSHGIGIKYIKSHLENTYQHYYKLSITNDKDFYSAFLSIEVQAMKRNNNTKLVIL